MVSPEVLNRYSFFHQLDSTSLGKLAGIAEEVSFKPGDTLYKAGQPSTDLILLEEGQVEAFLEVHDPHDACACQEVYLFDLDLHELLGLGALVEREIQTTTARAAQGGRLIRLDIEKLRGLCSEDPDFGFALMREIVMTLTSRLHMGFFCNRCPRAIADQLEQVKRGTVTGGRVLA